MDLQDLFKLLTSAIVGAIASFYIPALLKDLKFTNKEKILGDWHSTWQTNSASESPWSIEKVKITSQLGSVKIKNSENDNKYDWIATGRVNRGQYITGTWHSVKPGATSAGSFILSISNQGDAMLGFFVGPNRKGFINFGAWILVRDKEKLDNGKVEFTDMCPSINQLFQTKSPATLRRK